MSKGFITIGIDTDKDRIRYCYGLAVSIKISDNDAQICLVVDKNKADEVPQEYLHVFDYIVELPFGNTAYKDGFHGMNLWQLYHCTPFDETIYIDGDTLLHNVTLGDLWEQLSLNNMSVPYTARTYRNLPTTRAEFEFEHTYELPQLYYNIMYWKQETQEAIEWFKMADPIMQNWRAVYSQFFQDKKPDTFDKNILCNITTHCVDIEDQIKIQMANHYNLKMKSAGIWGEDFPDDWTETLNYWVSDKGKIQIENSIISSGIIHYSDEKFLTDHCLDVFTTNLTENQIRI